MNPTPSYGTCRFCGAGLTHSFVDLGMHPLCQSQVAATRVNEMEPFYPLHAMVCDGCFLVQLPEVVPPEAIFTEYAYFSSFSDSWLKHVEAYTTAMIDRFGIGPKSRVMEIASNDGYLLQYFRNRKIPVLGIEPAANVAEAAVKKGIPTVVKFFGSQTAREIAGEHGPADLLLGNNVLAHVPALVDFVEGMKALLAPAGVLTMEFPHLRRLVEGNQFDTIYHEHFSYFSFSTVRKVFSSRGLTLFDVEELPTHGGSLRIYGRHAEDAARPVSESVETLCATERDLGMEGLEYYRAFGEKVRETKRKLLEFLIGARREGKTIGVYGAAGKTNTLLNACGIRRDMIDFAVDRNPYKQGSFLPGSRIPVFPPDEIRARRPDYLLIGIWNLKDEVMKQTADLREWGGRWVVPIPEVRIYE